MISEEMCTTIKTLFEKGYNISQIARMLNIDRKTVRKKLNGTTTPKYTRRSGECSYPWIRSSLSNCRIYFTFT